MLEFIDETVEGIIFDLDGTFADTMPLHYKASNLACNEYGFDFPIDMFYELAGIPTFEVFNIVLSRLKITEDYKVIAQKKEDTFLELIPEVQTIKQVEEVALKFKGKIPLSIGSGGLRETVELTLKNLGYCGFFDAIVTSNDVANHKPHPETFVKAAKLMNVSPEKCIVFEDGDPGIEAAVKANMKFIDVRLHL